MSEWWTYRPSDFLMFAPRIYWRLFESINAAYWPLHVLIGAAVFAWAWRGERWPRASGFGLAALFVLCGWAFLHERLTPIFWVAGVYAWAFAIQALLLTLIALGGARGSGVAISAQARIARVLALWTVLGHPMLALLAGRPWTQAEWPGLAPDPTALLALAWLVLAPTATGWRRALQRAAWIVPIAWCIASAATLATMGEWQAIIMLAAPALAVLFAMKTGLS